MLTRLVILDVSDSTWLDSDYREKYQDGVRMWPIAAKLERDYVDLKYMGRNDSMS